MEDLEDLFFFYRKFFVLILYFSPQIGLKSRTILNELVSIRP
ncbi:MAG: hypothetical protein ACJAZP_001965 [Psychromonas sp.]|jgi:hypothetical protein